MCEGPLVTQTSLQYRPDGQLLAWGAQNMALQWRAGADCIAVLDTCAGELDPAAFDRWVVPQLTALLAELQRLCPEARVLYYSKGTDARHWRRLESLPLAGIGIDWRTPLVEALEEFGDRWAIQGNFDPHAMLTDWERGEVSTDPEGRTVREFVVTAEDKEVEIAPGIMFPTWTYNGRIPGPTLRVTEGERIRIRFRNFGSHPHSMHFHGVHAARMDGVPGAGLSTTVLPAARAGPSFQMAMMKGKFQGAMPATTPTGRRMTSEV